MPHKSHRRKHSEVKVPKKGTTPKSKSKSRSKSRSKSSRGKHANIADELHKLKRKRYTDKDIARALMDNARSDVSRHLSKEDLRKLSRPVKQFGERWGEMRHELQAWLKIFDKAYFFGALSRCLNPIKITSEEDWTRGVYEPDKKRIVINTDQGEGKGSSTEEYLTTLLHECVHAFIHQYSCACRECLKREPASKGGVGVTGHGAPWANAMTKIEESFQDLVSWDVECGVEEGVCLEMRERRWQPREEQFERWGMSYMDADAMPPPMFPEEPEMRYMLCAVM